MKQEFLKARKQVMLHIMRNNPGRSNKQAENIIK